MTLQNVDVAVTQLINSLASHSLLLDALLRGASAAGIPLLVVAVACQWWVSTGRQGTRHVLVGAGLSFLLGLAFNQIVLLLVDRTRPYAAGVTNLLIAPSADPSFPSDHSTAAVAIAMAFALNGMPRRATWFGLAAVVVAFSRVYLGIHYAGDVLGGALTGALAAVTVSRLYVPGTRADRFITGIL